MSHKSARLSVNGKPLCLLFLFQELDTNHFKNVILILKAIEKVIEQDEDCFHTLVQQGVVVMMSILSTYLFVNH